MRPEVERRLIGDLERLRRETPFSVDVTARVLTEVRRLGPPPRTAVASRRVVVWAAAAVVALAAGLAVFALPGLPGTLGDLAQATARAAGLGGAALRLAAQMPAAAAHGLASTVDFLSAFRGLAGALAPAVAVAMAAALLGMAGITTYVVGRDLRHRRAEAR